MTRHSRGRARGQRHRVSSGRFQQPDKPTGLLSAFLRFFCHVPLGMYGIYAIENYVSVRKHAGLLLQSPLGNQFLAIEGLAGVMVGEPLE
jgi:hypothetical protein